MNATLYNTKNEFYYYTLDENNKIVEHKQLSDIPEEIECCNAYEAYNFLVKNGCCNISNHIIRGDYHLLCIETIKYVIEKYGVIIPAVYRGVNTNDDFENHLILFGSLSKKIAEFYGECILEFNDVKGLLFESFIAKSVLTNNYSQIDIEVLFLPVR